MNASERRALPLLLRHPVLLASPMLGVAAFNFVLWKIAYGFDDHFFPRIPVPVVRHGSRAALPVVFAGLRHTSVRLVITSSTQIVQIILESFAVALTIMLVTHLYSRGADTFGSAIQRLRAIPALSRTLFLFALRLFGIGLVGVLVAALLVVLFLVPHGAHVALPTATALLWRVAILASFWIAVAAYFAMPYFVDVVLYIQQHTVADDSVRRQVEAQARRYAWIAIGAGLVLGLCGGYANLSVAGTAATNHVVAGAVVKLAVDLITEVPKIAFVVAVAMLVMRTTAPERESEPA